MTFSRKQLLTGLLGTAFALAAPAASAPLEKASFAVGCFWCIQPAYDGTPGVVKTTVGYTGGQEPHPTYEEVSSGRTGHAESIEVVFDPSRIGYEELLGYFFRMHDPTTLDRQGHEASLLQTIGRYAPEYIVLAKYMRVLSPAFVDRFPRRIINIHHSFLPAFAGAGPYRPA